MTPEADVLASLGRLGAEILDLELCCSEENFCCQNWAQPSGTLSGACRRVPGSPASKDARPLLASAFQALANTRVATLKIALAARVGAHARRDIEHLHETPSLRLVVHELPTGARAS